MGSGHSLKRSIWPEAVWESPTTPCRKGVCVHRECSQTEHKARDSGLAFDSSVCLSPWLLGYQPQGGRSQSGSSQELLAAQVRKQRPGSPGCIPGRYHPTPGEVEGQPSSDDTQIHCLEAAAKEECRAWLPESLHFSCWQDHVVGTL